jgi:hypothetical protein
VPSVCLTRWSKYSNTNRKWGRLCVFPSAQLSVAPRSDAVCRHHLNESGLQEVVHHAAQRASIVKPIGPHTPCHCFAPHPSKNHYDPLRCTIHG